MTHSTVSSNSSISHVADRSLALNVRSSRVDQSCPWVGLTHGLGWAGLGRDFSVIGGLGWVHYSKSAKNVKGLF